MDTLQALPHATLVQKKEIAEGHFLIWLKPSVPIAFEPGQYIAIGKEGIERPYSIVSSPDEENIELFLDVIPKGRRTEKSLTPKLSALKPGDQVSIRPQTKGKFTLDASCETHVMIATVTGIAPFISMIRAYQKGYYKKKFSRPIYLFQGASYRDEFGYDQELEEAAKKGAIVYVPTISRPNEKRNEGWQGQIGRVNNILESYFKKFNIYPDPKTMVYLCGNRGMIEHLGNRRERPNKPLGKLVTAGFKTKEEIFF